MPINPTTFRGQVRVTLNPNKDPVPVPWTSVSNYRLPPLNLTRAFAGAALSNDADDVRVEDLEYSQYRDATDSGDRVRGLSNFWFIGNPNSAGLISGDYLYYTRALTDGKVVLCQRNLNTQEILTRVLVGNWAASDHNTGAVFDRDNNGRIAVIASEHSRPGFLAWRMATPHDMNSIGAPIDMAAALGIPADSSYVQVFFSPLFPGRTFCMFRTGSATWVRQIAYSDAADLSTWSTPVTVIGNNGVANDRPYPVIVYDNSTNRLYMLFSRDNPEDTTPAGGDANNTPLYAGYIQFAAGAESSWTVCTMAGTSLGAYGAVDLNLTNATNTWQAADRVAWPWHAFMCSGQPAFIISSTESSSVGSPYTMETRVLRWNGTVFTAVTLSETASTSSLDYYPAGACSADFGLTIYACTGNTGATNAASNQRVIKYVTADNWATAPTPTELEGHAGKSVRFVWAPQTATGVSDPRCLIVVDDGYYDRITQNQELRGNGHKQVFFGRKAIVVSPVLPSIPAGGQTSFNVFAGQAGLAAGNTAPSEMLLDWCWPSLGRCALTRTAARFFENLAAFSIECLFDLHVLGAGTSHYIFSGWPSSGNLGGPMIRYNASAQLEVVTVIGVTTTTTTMTNLARPPEGRHHVVLNYSAPTGIQVFQNGVQGTIAQAIGANYLNTGTIATPLSALSTGHAPGDTQIFGRMRMCRIRNRVLTPAEVQVGSYLTTTPGAITFSAVSNASGPAPRVFIYGFDDDEDKDADL